jgi:hypothetical protein
MRNTGGKWLWILGGCECPLFFQGGKGVEIGKNHGARYGTARTAPGAGWAICCVVVAMKA